MYNRPYAFMAKVIRYSFLILLVFMCAQPLQAQTNADRFTPTSNYNTGIGVVAPDSLMSLNFRFRMQARAGYRTRSETDLSASEIEARIRRLRLRFEGFMLSPKLNYYIQLSFSRGDMDWVDNDNSAQNSSPNVVRDAVVIYKPNSNLSLTFGQTKLPGNRQRVVSSGELQFADRSIVNANFNIDRDFGLQAAYQNQLAGLHYVLRGAITSGEGRNSVISDAGLAYTGRIELLPFGKFTNKGDYFEGDLEREQTPKLSVAAGYHYNESARRTAGTLGKDLYQSRNLEAFIADMLLKYQGFAVTAEYITRQTDAPITRNAQLEERSIYVGEGKMVQLSYVTKNDFEFAGRYALISPFSAIADRELEQQEMGIGVTKYLRKHRVKLQGNLFYNQSTNLTSDQIVNRNWAPMFQIEFGI
jgi:phosphate-selective porin OprO and OprP